MEWERKKHPLEYPVHVPLEGGGESVELTVVTVSAPNGRALRSINAMNLPESEEDQRPLELEEVLQLIEILSDLPPGGIDELHADDITALGAIAVPFLAPKQADAAPPKKSGKSPRGSQETATK